LIKSRSYVYACALCLGLVHASTNVALADTLDDALRASLQNSSEIAAARQGWLAARENIETKTSTSDLKATLSVTGNQSHTDTPTSNGYKQSEYGSGSITVAKNLYDGGQTSANMKLAQIQLDEATASYLATEQNVILTSIEAYLNVLKSRRDVNLNESNLKRLQAHVDAARIRVEAGAATPTRLAEAEARHARAKSNALVAATDLQNAEDAYKSLTGLQAGDLTLPATTENLPKQIGEAEKLASSMHPYVQAALAAERAADQAFDTLKAGVSPTLSLSLSATSKDATGTSSDSDVLAGSLVFSTPILSTNATRAKARNVAASHQQAKYARAEAVRAAKVRARAAFRTQETAKINLDAVQRELKASKLVAAGIASEAQFGQKTTLDLLDAEQDVNDAELRLVTAEHNLRLAAYRLQAAIGGLTAESLGLGAVLGTLDNMPMPADPFSTTFPFSRRIAE
jgi:outer membrane protein